ncbi:MAG TPA: hypothetical protein VFB72_10440 [Verrucomicrobiae bacterium]|nr:hypothetical protein [Verrucomicrobiae bacterium]
MAAHRVRALLMGGQACVFYGAAEFSRDTDLAILADAENWKRLTKALSQLEASCIAVPPARLEYLLRGHAVHFRCHHPDAENMRVDVMSVMRGVDDFPRLWERRTSLADSDGMIYELISLPDLVLAKKTQRSRDWPMITRLVQEDYMANRAKAEPAQVRFWLRELRTPEMMIEAVNAHPEMASQMMTVRPLLALAVQGLPAELECALGEEEKLEREADRVYWKPLKEELERLRHHHPK